MTARKEYQKAKKAEVKRLIGYPSAWQACKAHACSASCYYCKQAGVK